MRYLISLNVFAYNIIIIMIQFESCHCNHQPHTHDMLKLTYAKNGHVFKNYNPGDDIDDGIENKPGQEHFLEAQYYFLQKLVRAGAYVAGEPHFFASNTDRDKAEVFGLDTIVARGADWTPCEVKSGYRTGCNFNEVVICSKMHQWLSFEISGTREFTTGWFRWPWYDYSEVKPWYYLETRNRLLSVTLRHGSRDKWCNCNEDSGWGCPADTQTFSSEWDVITDDDGIFLFSRFRSSKVTTRSDGVTGWEYEPIICMKFWNVGLSTCDISKHLDEGYKFIHPGTGFIGGDGDGGGPEEVEIVIEKMIFSILML